MLSGLLQGSNLVHCLIFPLSYVHFSLCQESLSSQLVEKEQTMEKWRKERDTLVAALEVQLKKLLSSQAEKDKLIQQLRQNNPQLPQEVSIA